MKLVVATHNAHKTGEIREIIGSWFDEIEDLTSHPEIEPAEETGGTFLENADIKALAAARHLPSSVVLADDSGLEVDALDLAPGVYSARYAGEGATDADNRRKVLEELDARGLRHARPRARFRCVLSLVKEGVQIAHCEGSVEGTIAPHEQGENGFGYDPVFIPEGHEQTFGELPSETKHAMSHRGRALAQLAAILEGGALRDEE